MGDDVVWVGMWARSSMMRAERRDERAEEESGTRIEK